MMSAIGTKRTSLVALHMSAFGGKADMPFCSAMSAYDPKRTLGLQNCDSSYRQLGGTQRQLCTIGCLFSGVGFQCW